MNNPTQLKDAMKDIVAVLYPLRNALKSNRKFVESLLHIFVGISDFRESIKVKYKLENIMAICLLIAMKEGFKSFSYAATYIRVKDYYFKKFKLIEGNNYPSHDTLYRIFCHIDANELRDVMINRIDTFVERIAAEAASKDPVSASNKLRLISGDGKTFNGSGRKGKKRNVNVFNVMDTSNGICRTSIPLDDKDSEIPTFQWMLQKYNLKGVMVTADALHCQRKTAEIISKKGGLYTLVVKDNQSALKAHIVDMLKLNKAKLIRETFNNGEYEIYIIDYKLTDEDFPNAKAYVRYISHKRKDQVNYSPLPMFFVSSADNPQLIMETIDNRWKIEGDFHWLKDGFLLEDKCTFTNKNAIKVMATLNNIAYALYRIASAIFFEESMQATRIRYQDCPEEMLAKMIPLLEKKNLTALLKENMKGRKKAVPQK